MARTRTLAPAAAQRGKARDLAFPREGLLAPRINTLSKSLMRGAVQFAKAQFGLSQVEWQVVTLLGVFQPISIRELAYHALLDAAQISRAVTVLSQRGCVVRGRSERDSREAVLTLTPEGEMMHARLTEAALARNRALVGAYSDADMARFYEMLDVFIGRSLQLAEGEGTDGRS